MILAIVGRSCTGKSTLAMALSRQFGNCPTRYCGEIVKARAMDLAVPVADLPADQHSAIDSATREWTEAQTDMAVVEGRYLHYVLEAARADVRLVEVVCSGSERQRRWAVRLGREIDEEELRRFDTADQSFEVAMYGNCPQMHPVASICTDIGNVEWCVQRILDSIRGGGCLA